MLTDTYCLNSPFTVTNELQSPETETIVGLAISFQRFHVFSHLVYFYYHSFAVRVVLGLSCAPSKFLMGERRENGKRGERRSEEGDKKLIEIPFLYLVD